MGVYKLIMWVMMLLGYSTHRSSAVSCNNVVCCIVPMLMIRRDFSPGSAEATPAAANSNRRCFFELFLPRYDRYRVLYFLRNVCHSPLARDLVSLLRSEPAAPARSRPSGTATSGSGELRVEDLNRILGGLGTS